MFVATASICHMGVEVAPQIPMLISSLRSAGVNLFRRMNEVRIGIYFLTFCKQYLAIGAFFTGDKYDQIVTCGKFLYMGYTIGYLTADCVVKFKLCPIFHARPDQSPISLNPSKGFVVWEKRLMSREKSSLSISSLLSMIMADSSV